MILWRERGYQKESGTMQGGRDPIAKAFVFFFFIGASQLSMLDKTSFNFYYLKEFPSG